MKTLLLLGGVLLSIGTTQAQSEIKNPNDKTSLAVKKNQYETRELMAELSGTYQVKVVNSDVVPALSKQDLLDIKNARKEDETVVLSRSESIKFVIPSYSEINSSAFEPLEAVIYINSNY